MLTIHNTRTALGAQLERKNLGQYDIRYLTTMTHFFTAGVKYDNSNLASQQIDISIFGLRFR
jgi:hypothetical protein